MKRMIYIIATLLVLNAGSLFASSDNDIVPGTSSNTTLSVKDLAPVTPKEANFEDSDYSPVTNPSVPISLYPEVPMTADFEVIIPELIISIESLVPAVTTEAGFSDNF